MHCIPTHGEQHSEHTFKQNQFVSEPVRPLHCQLRIGSLREVAVRDAVRPVQHQSTCTFKELVLCHIGCHIVFVLHHLMFLEQVHHILTNLNSRKKETKFTAIRLVWISDLNVFLEWNKPHRDDWVLSSGTYRPCHRGSTASYSEKWHPEC